MAECARVLRPGARLCVSDLTVEQDDLPPEILTQPAAWAGVAGALAEDDFVRKLEKAGFQNVEIVHREPMSIDDCALYPLFSDHVIQLMKQLIRDARGRTPSGGIREELSTVAGSAGGLARGSCDPPAYRSGLGSEGAGSSW
jgi:hypothetical protein